MQLLLGARSGGGVRQRRGGARRSLSRRDSARVIDNFVLCHVIKSSFVKLQLSAR